MRTTLLSFLLFSCLSTFGQNSFDRWVPISGTNTYTTNITSYPASYNNTKIYGQFTNGNTTNATFQIPALSAVPIRKWDGDSWELLASGDIDAGDYAELVYDNSNAYFRLTIIKAASSGSGSTPTLQQVLTAGSVLTGNNEITGPRNTSIQVGDETTGGIHGIEATSDQVILKSDTFYIQDIAGGNTIYSDNGIDESGIARGGDQIVFNGTTGITLTTDNTDGIKVSGGGTLAQTSGLLTKDQVGDYITSRQFKKSVKASSTANIADLNNAGASMDGITLATQDRVLLKDQSTGSQNGIYNVVSLTPTVLTRVGDFSSSTFEGVLTNTLVLVDQGTANGGKAYRLSTTGTITIGTTALTFTEFSIKNLSGSATIDFGSIASQDQLTSNITVTDAADGDEVILGYTNAAAASGVVYTARVSATNTVTVTAYNITLSPVDPGSGIFKVSVIKR